jgi:adenylate cyclase class IV
VRTYRAPQDAPVASLDWKGAVRVAHGYKEREELSVGAADPEALMTILDKLGYQLTMAIDREIWQYELDGASVRIERYPRMDVLVEVEGEPAAIESAIERLGIPRTEFTSDTLPAFVRRFERRTGTEAVLSGPSDHHANVGDVPRQAPERTP